MTTNDDARNDPVADLTTPELLEGRASAARAILRRAQHLPKPKDWQDFQFRCVILFQDELLDPSCKEYGRPGQKQGGIDIPGRRDGRFVGIQCRRVETPLTEKTIRSDVNDALALDFDFCEIIFATTAPDSTQATDAAHTVEQELRKQGKDIKIDLYGWEALQQLIARHDRASAFFNPETAGASRQQSFDTTTNSRIEEKIDRLSEMVAARSTSILTSTSDSTPVELEDAPLHARIDVLRDLMRDGEARIALDRLSALLPTIDPVKTPFACFRVKTNIASCLLNLGQEKEAANLFAEAYELVPNDSRAIANLAVARLIFGDPNEAMRLARDALGRDEKNGDAVGVLLQAAARSDWQGDPITLVPDSLRGTQQADMGLLEFQRVRNHPAWVDTAREFATRHKDRYFAHMAALAVLERVTKGGAFVPGEVSTLLPGELLSAADTLKAAFLKRERLGIEKSDLVASGNNAAVALRVAGRSPEAIDVLRTTIARAGTSAASLVRMLGVLQAVAGDIPGGIATLATIPEDGEAQLARAEMLADTDAGRALTLLHSINTTNLQPLHRESRATLWAELAISLGSNEEYCAAIEELGSATSSPALLQLMSIQGDLRFKEFGLDEAKVRLAEVARDIDSAEPITTRIVVAQKLAAWGDNATASMILEGQVDLSSPSAATKFFIQTLAAGRRDELLDHVIALSSKATLADPDILWITAAHAWNTGDLVKAHSRVDALLQADETNLRGVLLKAEILVREDRVIELKGLLEKPLESYPSKRLNDRFRLVQLLLHFGFLPRAAALAYRLFLENRDQSRAWMTMVSVVLARGETSEGRTLFNTVVAGENAAVDILFDNGNSRLLVIEPDPKLRALDADALEPGHELAQALKGLGKGAMFELANGRVGEITDVRSKYVARFHDVLARYEDRFPTVFGFKSFSIDPTAKNGLEAIIAQVKERHDFVTEETKAYVNGILPLAVLAHRVGVDIIDAASGVAETGNKVKVCSGHETDRLAAELSIRRNKCEGCIVDPLAYWTLHRLGALEAVVQTCGPIHISRRTIDILRDRRARLLGAGMDGFKSLTYHDGQIALTEFSGEYVSHAAEDIDRAIAWAQTNARIDPVRASESLPDSVRSFLQTGRTDIMDECVLAHQTGLLFISDDEPIRQVARSLGVGKLTWVQLLLGTAVERGHLSVEAYVRDMGALLEAGQTYLGVSSVALVAALEIDVADGASEPGPLFKQLLSPLGGATADPISHASVVLQTLSILWSQRRFIVLRPRATGLLLEAVVKDRASDYREILGGLLRLTKARGALQRYIMSWLRGHFIRI